MEMKQPKVLVACPTYEGKDYCIDDWMKHIKSLTYKNYDIFIVDNTADKGEHARWITETYGVPCAHHYKRKANLSKVMAECNEMIRKKVISEGYDYLMSIESDVFPPKNIIQRFLNQGKLHIAGIYKIGFGKWKYPLLQIVEKTGESKDGFDEGNIRQMHWMEMIPFIDGATKPIHGCGLGCALMHRTILEKFKFRTVKGRSVHADSWWYMDMWNAGVPAFVDTSVICEHRNKDWMKVWDKRNKEFDEKFKFTKEGKELERKDG